MADGNAGNRTPLLNEVSLSELVDLVRRNWLYNQKHVPHVAKQMFIVEKIGTGQGNSKRYDEIDTETYAHTKPEGENSSKTTVAIGYSLEMTAKTISREIDITLEMRDDNRYGDVKSLLTSLSQFCANRMDLDLTHRITFATSTSYTDMNGYTINVETGDGLALCSATKTLAHSSTTYRNRVSGDPAFSQGAFETAMNLTTNNIFSNLGEKRVMNFNTIFSTDDYGTVREIRQMLESTADIDGQHEGIKNVYMGTKKHVVLPQLATDAYGAPDTTKRRWWGIAAIGQGRDGWQAFLGIWKEPQLITPGGEYNGKDIHNYNWTFSTYARYGICIPSGRGFILSPVSN